MLILLDNCEHLVPFVATVVERLLSGAKGLHVLATSRQSLGVIESALSNLGTFLRDDPAGTLPPAMADVDLAVNTVPHPALAAELWTLEHGGLLINVADRSPIERERLRSVSDPRGTVLLNWGVVPGISALLAHELATEDPAADAIELAVTFSAVATSGTAGGEFLHRELTRRHRHATAAIPFPAPIGARRCIGMAEGQDGWMGAAAGGRRVSSYVCLTEPGLTPALRLVNRLGLMRALPRRAFQVGRGRSQRELSRERFCVWVAASRGGRRLGARAVSGRGMYRCTGVAALAAATLLDAARLPAGCLDPHEAISLDELVPLPAVRELEFARRA